ncbi:hypothetical protein SS50377_24723 [Spironucleus salmonicida]|uniref:Uncharacterized protein n=1 Tax=Spironucleus salmonicida TaxID=348837 RepID=V6LUX3_9EUKA|nr:hypothetical protein SS50377_24723 [Spironucleus salmonicida]|eukprot:EST44604.1 Hypothetical protein SS50377_15609 [Spironucleus salmonicida]
MDFIYNTLSTASVAAVGTAAYYLFKNKEKIGKQFQQMDSIQENNVDNKKDVFIKELIRQSSPNSNKQRTSVQDIIQQPYKSPQLIKLVEIPQFEDRKILNIRKSFNNKITLSKQLLAYKIGFFEQDQDIISLIQSLYEVFQQAEGLYQLQSSFPIDKFESFLKVNRQDFVEFDIFEFSINADILLIELNFENIHVFNYLDQQILYIFDQQQTICLQNITQFIDNNSKYQSQNDLLSNFVQNKYNKIIQTKVFQYIAQKCEIKCQIDLENNENILIIEGYQYYYKDGVLLSDFNDDYDQELKLLNKNQITGQQLVNSLQISCENNKELHHTVIDQQNSSPKSKMQNLLQQQEYDNRKFPQNIKKSPLTKKQSMPQQIVTNQQIDSNVVPLQQLTQTYLQNLSQQIQLKESFIDKLSKNRLIRQIQQDNLIKSQKPSYLLLSQVNQQPYDLSQLSTSLTSLSKSELKNLDLSTIITRRTTDSTSLLLNQQPIIKIFKSFDQSFFPNQTLLKFKPNYNQSSQQIKDLFELIYTIIQLGTAEISLSLPLSHEDFSLFISLLSTDFPEFYFISFSQTENRLNIHLTQNYDSLDTIINQQTQLSNQLQFPQNIFKIHKFIAQQSTKHSVSNAFSFFLFGASNQEISSSIFTILAQNCNISCFVECGQAIVMHNNVEYFFDPFLDSLSKNEIVMYENCGKYGSQILYFNFHGMFIQQTKGIKKIIDKWNLENNLDAKVYVNNELDQLLVVQKIQYYLNQKSCVLVSQKRYRNTFMFSIRHGFGGMDLNIALESSQSINDNNLCEDLSEISIIQEYQESFNSQECLGTQNITDTDIQNIPQKPFLFPFQFIVDDCYSYCAVQIRQAQLYTMKIFEYQLVEEIVYDIAIIEKQVNPAQFFDQIINDEILYSKILIQDCIPEPLLFFDNQIDEQIKYEPIIIQNGIPDPNIFFLDQVFEDKIYERIECFKQQKKGHASQQKILQLPQIVKNDMFSIQLAMNSDIPVPYSLFEEELHENDIQ